MTVEPGLSKPGAKGAAVRAVVLVLHGGQERSTVPATRWYPAYWRMVPFARDLRRAGRGAGVAVWLMCNRYRGWNQPELDPVADARWALEAIRRAHPGVPVVLVGHSMGGRVALRVADDPAIAGVCVLAPWTPAGEPVAQLADRTVLIAHGDRDRITDPGAVATRTPNGRRWSPTRSAGSTSAASHTRCCAGTRDGRCWSDGSHSACSASSTWTTTSPTALAKPAPDGLRVPI